MRKLKKISEMMTSPQSTTQIEDFDNCARKLQKIRCKTIHRKKTILILQYFLGQIVVLLQQSLLNK